MLRIPETNVCYLSAIMCQRVTFAEVVELLKYYRSFAKAMRSKAKKKNDSMHVQNNVRPDRW